MFYSIYFAYFHPNARIMDFRLELFNEWAIQIMCFHLMCFSDMVQLTTEPLINYKLGESFKIFVSFVIVFNLVVFGHSLVGPVRTYLKRRKFRKALPNLIEQRMKQREGDTKKANAALQNKIDSIMNNFQQEVVQDENTAQSLQFKKQFFMNMQAKNRENEIAKMRNLDEDHDTITKKVFKDRKHQKMAQDGENLYSSSSDEDDITKTIAPTLKHVFKHKLFNDLTTGPLK